MNHSFFSSRAWLRQALLAGWGLVGLWLGIEWLLPGAISAEIPVFAVAGAMVFCTFFFGPLLATSKSRMAAVIGFALPLTGGSIGIGLFMMRETSSLIRMTAMLAISLAGLAVAQSLVEDSP